MLFSFLIASVSAGPTNTAGIDPMPINITNRCGVDGAMDHEFVVTLKPPPADLNGRRLDTTEDKLSFLQGWVHQYDPEDTSNGTTRRKLEANSNSTHVLHLFTKTRLGVSLAAGDPARHAQHARISKEVRPSPLRAYNHGPHAPRTPQVVMRMAEDPAVSSVECDCYIRADMSLPESDGSSPGTHDQVEAVGMYQVNGC